MFEWLNHCYVYTMFLNVMVMHVCVTLQMGVIAIHIALSWFWASLDNVLCLVMERAEGHEK